MSDLKELGISFNFGISNEDMEWTGFYIEDIQIDENSENKVLINKRVDPEYVIIFGADYSRSIWSDCISEKEFPNFNPIVGFCSEDDLNLDLLKGYGDYYKFHPNKGRDLESNSNFFDLSNLGKNSYEDEVWLRLHRILGFFKRVNSEMLINPLSEDILCKRIKLLFKSNGKVLGLIDLYSYYWMNKYYKGNDNLGLYFVKNDFKIRDQLFNLEYSKLNDFRLPKGYVEFDVKNLKINVKKIIDDKFLNILYVLYNGDIEFLEKNVKFEYRDELLKVSAVRLRNSSRISKNKIL